MVKVQICPPRVCSINAFESTGEISFPLMDVSKDLFIPFFFIFSLILELALGQSSSTLQFYLIRSLKELSVAQAAMNLNLEGGQLPSSSLPNTRRMGLWSDLNQFRCSK